MVTKQAGSIVRPQSRFVVCDIHWIHITLLLARLVLTTLTVADSHLTWCAVSHAYTAILFFQSFLFTAALCPVNCFSSVLLFYQCTHGYTHCRVPHIPIPLFFRVGMYAMTFIIASLSFFLLPQIILTQRGRQTCSVFSVIPWMYGRNSGHSGSFCFHGVTGARSW